jgi:hypothetical protein
MFRFFITFLVISCFATNAFADLRTSEFTSEFVTCVKRYEDERLDFVRPGLAESSLMNGSSILPSAPLDGGYWGYMNCINGLDDNDEFGVATSTNPTCPQRIIELPGRQIKIRSAPAGKVVGVLGYFFRCEGGAGGASWVSIDGRTINPVGADREVPEPVTEDNCLPKEVTVGQCKFPLPGTQNKRTVESSYGAYYGDDDNNNQGYIRAVCRNGDFDVIESSCFENTCEVGKVVTWHGVDFRGNVSQCQGPVKADGSVEHQSSGVQFFSSLPEAISRTRVLQGNTDMTCKDGVWQPPQSSSGGSCFVKAPEELVCDSINIANERSMFFCE